MQEVRREKMSRFEFPIAFALGTVVSFVMLFA